MLLGEPTSAEADPTGEINPGARIDYRERNADSGVRRRIHVPAPSLQTMIRRWTALGVVTAEKKFRRIKGYRHMGALVQALRSKQKSLDSDAFAA